MLIFNHYHHLYGIILKKKSINELPEFIKSLLSRILSLITKLEKFINLRHGVLKNFLKNTLTLKFVKRIFLGNFMKKKFTQKSSKLFLNILVLILFYKIMD